MKLSSFLHFAAFGVRTILLREKKPILGTVIVTDRCNLKCRHCSVHDLTSVDHPYEQIRREMEAQLREETEQRNRELAMVREEMDRLIERLHMLKSKVKAAEGEEQAG